MHPGGTRWDALVGRRARRCGPHRTGWRAADPYPEAVRTFPGRQQRRQPLPPGHFVLALFGFVVSSPFRGTEVRKISTQDLLEIYPIRAALEGVAARTAATRIDESTIAHLGELIAAMRDAAERGDQRAHATADFAFHHAIVKASGNRMLEQVWQSLRLATTTSVTHSLAQMTHRTLQEIGERHIPVLEALRARDAIGAEAAMRAHIEGPGEWIINAINQQQIEELHPSKGAANDRR